MMGTAFKALLSPLKASLILFGSVWLGMGLLAYYVAHNYDRSLAELNEAKQALQVAQTQQNQQQQHLAWFNQYLPAYEHWQAIGLVGEEQRLNWVHRLQTIQKQQQLPVVQYTVAEQLPHVPAFVSLGHFLMRKSTMHVDMLMQGDMTTQMLSSKADMAMLRLLQAMRQQHPASMQLQYCDFKALEKSIHSRCEIDWLTLQEPLYQTWSHETAQ